MSSETLRATLGKPVGKVASRVLRVTDRKGTIFLHRSEDSFALEEETDDVGVGGSIIQNHLHPVSQAKLST